MKKQKSFLLVFLLLFTFLPTSIAKGPSNSSQYIGGKSTQIVRFDLDNDLGMKLVTANNKIIGAENSKNMIARNKPLAAINGNFFDAYNSLVPYGSMVKDGRVVYLEGNNASFFVDNYNNVGIDLFSMTLQGSSYSDPSKKSSFSVWYVNTQPHDSSGVYIYTPDYGSSINLKGGTSITVEKDIVTRIDNKPARSRIPKDGYLIYYAPYSAGPDYVKNRFELGNIIELEQKYSKNIFEKYTGKAGFENPKIMTMISAGPYLVENSVNVVEKYKAGFEDKISTYAAQRSAIGITKDNEIVMITQANSTVNQLANSMINLGCDRAINLDGGASSALYSNSRHLTHAGRNLNNMLMLVKQAKPAKEIIISYNDSDLYIPREFGQIFINSDDRTMVPVRFISESLGHSVSWEQSSRTIGIDDRIQLQIGSDQALVDGDSRQIDTKAILVDERTMVPLRFISETLGYHIDFETNAYINRILISD